MSKVDLKRDSEKRPKTKMGRKHKRDAKLQELEKQLEFAESRCGTLKQQLDYIKLLYGCGKRDNEENQQKEEGHGDCSNVNYYSYPDLSRWNQFNKYYVAREAGDCPVITKQAVSHSNSTGTDSSNKPLSIVLHQEKNEELRRKGKQRNNIKLLKVKKKNCKKIKKRRRDDDASLSKISNASSQTQTHSWQDAVVEIYKNVAIKAESESGFDLVAKKSKTYKPNEVMGEIKQQKFGGKNSEDAEEMESKEKSLGETKAKSWNSFGSKKPGCLLKEEGIQTEQSLEVNQSSQTRQIDNSNKEFSPKPETVSTEPVKNYCQPTISSKRKQVERDIYSNLTNINVRNIPFIAAKSTAPSHNIGVNIQQVLSIIKKRHPIHENSANSNPEVGVQENPLITLLSSKKIGSKTSDFEPRSEAGTAVTVSSRRSEGVRTSMSHWRSNSENNKLKQTASNEKIDENQSNDWNLKVSKLKRVLVFLHEDFTALSQKYKRLQKKLTKRNITKTDAKDELADIERDLEKKEEEIIVVIGLYKEVLTLKEDFKKLQEKYNMVASGRSLIFEGLKQSNSTHTQMTTLLRKIQNFQEQLKG